MKNQLNQLKTLDLKEQLLKVPKETPKKELNSLVMRKKKRMMMILKAMKPLLMKEAFAPEEMEEQKR